MVEREHGYKRTEVSGTKLVIKERFEGSRESTAARRLAVREEVHNVKVEHDGVITAHICNGSKRWHINDYIPDDFAFVEALNHPSGNAHLDLARES